VWTYCYGAFKKSTIEDITINKNGLIRYNYDFEEKDVFSVKDGVKGLKQIIEKERKKSHVLVDERYDFLLKEIDNE
jgi:hypothetical protein